MYKSLQQPSRRDFLKLVGAVGGGVGATALLGGCGSSASGPASKTVGISLNGNNAYSGYVAEGVLKALDSAGFSFKGVQSNFDSSQELGNIQSLLSQGVSGIVVLPADAGTLAKAAQLAHQQNVAVGDALWPGTSDADKYFTAVADLDSVKGGRMIGQYLRDNATPGPVIVVQAIVGQGFSEKIDQGLDEVLQGSGFHVVVREQGMFDRGKATSIVETGLQAHPDVTAIVAYSASMSDGIAAYLKSRNITNIVHVSSDGDDEMMTWMKTPFLTSSRYYSAGQTGLVTGQAIVDKIQGKPVTFDNAIDQLMLTKANLDATLAKIPYRYPQFQQQAKTI